MLGTTLGLSAISKAIAFSGFADSLSSYYVPAGLARLAASAVIGTEALLAMVLAFGGGLLRLEGLLATVVLLVIFSAALVKNLSVSRRDRASCYCFGASARTVSWIDLIRNGGLITLAIAGELGILGANRSVLPPAGLANPEIWPMAMAGVFLALIWSQLAEVVGVIRGE